ncbi:MAG: hypothetical protein ACK4TA_17850 [Saprospiraceae bacterium]
MKKLLSFLFFVVTLVSLQAQEEDAAMSENYGRRMPAYSFNGNFQVGVPLDAFRDNLDGVGFGGGLLVLGGLGDTPISAGVELSIMGYDSETAEYRVRVGGFTKDYELTTSSNIFLGHAVVRIQPFGTGFITPYIDGMVGFKNLFTSSSLVDLDLGENTDTGIDESDWAFSYGGAFGLQFHFSKSHMLSLDLRCAYLPGNNASYLVRAPDPIGGFDYDDPLEAFEKKSSPTNLLLPQIGLTFKFWGNNSGSMEEGMEEEN